MNREDEARRLLKSWRDNWLGYVGDLIAQTDAFLAPAPTVEGGDEKDNPYRIPARELSYILNALESDTGLEERRAAYYHLRDGDAIPATPPTDAPEHCPQCGADTANPCGCTDDAPEGGSRERGRCPTCGGSIGVWPHPNHACTTPEPPNRHAFLRGYGPFEGCLIPGCGKPASDLIHREAEPARGDAMNTDCVALIPLDGTAPTRCNACREAKPFADLAFGSGTDGGNLQKLIALCRGCLGRLAFVVRKAEEDRQIETARSLAAPTSPQPETPERPVAQERHVFVPCAYPNGACKQYGGPGEGCCHHEPDGDGERVCGKPASDPAHHLPERHEFSRRPVCCTRAQSDPIHQEAEPVREEPCPDCDGTLNCPTRAPATSSEPPLCGPCRDGNVPKVTPNGYAWHCYPGDDPEPCTAPRDEKIARLTEDVCRLARELGQALAERDEARATLKQGEKIAAFVPGDVWIKAKERAGFATKIVPTAPAPLRSGESEKPVDYCDVPLPNNPGHSCGNVKPCSKHGESESER